MSDRSGLKRVIARCKYCGDIRKLVVYAGMELLGCPKCLDDGEPELIEVIDTYGTKIVTKKLT